jgi:hypothetical protein
MVTSKRVRTIFIAKLTFFLIGGKDLGVPYIIMILYLFNSKQLLNIF